MIEILLVFALAIGLAWPLGHYLAKVMRGAPMPGDRVFGWLEKPVYRLLGTDPQRGMSWRGYAKAFLLSNVAVGVLVWGLFMTQAWLPLNPDAVPNMRWDLALHTMVSFLTNTNQQHYSGQAQLSYLSQMVGIVGLQVATPMMGLALVVATLRALFGGKDGDAHVTGEANVGNYWADVTRATVRVLLPLCLVWSLLLTSQGVPSTLAAGPTVADTIANAALWFGLVRYLAESERPLWSQMSFSAAEENFHVAAQHGIDAQVYWPGIGQVRATELVLRRLLPMARAGLDSWGVPGEESDRYLGIIEQRCLLGTNGAEWFVGRMRQRDTEDRFDALRATLLEYRERMHTNEPAHTWE